MSYPATIPCTPAFHAAARLAIDVATCLESDLWVARTAQAVLSAPIGGRVDREDVRVVREYTLS